ncbi:MAG: ABC transporter ATP-binding protein [Candidatus Moranbacteria bacterium]|nr:ABC transporter ATP-binding protein [Candidatus Moranbacteria bacterium]
MIDASKKNTEPKRLPARRIFAWYWKVLRKYRRPFLFAVVSYGLAAVSGSVIPPIIYKGLTDTLSGAGSPEIFGRTGAWVWVSALGFNYLSTYVFFRLGDISYFRPYSRAAKDLVDSTFDRIESRSHGFFADHFSGSLVSQARRYVDSFGSLSDTIIYNIWMPTVNLIGSLIGLFVFSPPLAALFLTGMAIMLLLPLPLLRKRMSFDALESEEDSRVTGRLADVITNILTVKMFASGSAERKSFREFTDRQERARGMAYRALLHMIMLQNGLVLVFQFVGMAASVWLWSRGTITVGTVILMQAYLMGVFSIANQFNRSVSEILRSLARASEMVEIFELPQDLTDPERPEECRISKGRIAFRDVSFRYPGGDTVFEKFSFSVRAGEKVGLVGPSGGGKSTVTKLLLRFVDPQEGAIEIDGQDIRRIRQDDLRARIAYVPQDPLLFHRSLRENIGYGRAGASEEEMLSASRRAHADEFVARLPEGYDTLVGERGVKLSGGQRQRVAIARAILKNAPILVLDEATSALDSESEHAIQEALAELMTGKTAIVIAHRLSTIRRMDRIVVLGKDGRVEEEGTHDELLSRNGHYASLWERQTGGFIDSDDVENAADSESEAYPLEA